MLLRPTAASTSGPPRATAGVGPARTEPSTCPASPPPSAAREAIDPRILGRASPVREPAPLPAVGRPARQKRSDGLDASRPVTREARDSGLPVFAEKLLARLGSIPGTPAFLHPLVPRIIEPTNIGDPLRLPEGTERSVLVVGGGIAGMSAATELAERGFRVKVVEAESYLGGRLKTEPKEVGGDTLEIEHGYHAWFRTYPVLHDLIDRIGIRDNFKLEKEVHFDFPDYDPEVLKVEPNAHMLNMLGIIARSPNLSVGDAIGALPGLLPAFFYDHASNCRKYDGITFVEWAKQKKIPQKFLDVFLYPAMAVTLNQVEKISAAQMFELMWAYFMARPDANEREVTKDDHRTSFITPWQQHLEEAGVAIETGRRVAGLMFEDGKVVGELDAEGRLAARYDHVILATETPGLKAVLSGSKATDAGSARALDALRDVASKLEVAPRYHVLRVGFADRAPKAERPAVLEVSRNQPLEVIIRFDALEEGSRRHVESGKSQSIMEFHLYDTPEFEGLSGEELWARIAPDVTKIMPELAGARLSFANVEGHTNFTSYGVGQKSGAPTADQAKSVGVDNLVLAGDLVRLPFPAKLMEGAAASGRWASRFVCEAEGVRAPRLPVLRG